MALIVAREDGGPIDRGATLQVAAGADDPVSRAIALPLRDWRGGYAETRKGRRLFYLAPTGSESELRANCIVEGIVWSEFVSWTQAGVGGPLKRFCDEGMAAEQAAATERYRQRLDRITTPIRVQDAPVVNPRAGSGLTHPQSRR